MYLKYEYKYDIIKHKSCKNLSSDLKALVFNTSIKDSMLDFVKKNHGIKTNLTNLFKYWQRMVYVKFGLDIRFNS